MKNLIFFSLLFISVLSFGQNSTSLKRLSNDEIESIMASAKERTDKKLDKIKLLTNPERNSFRVEEDYDTAYFALYVHVQTSQITDDLLKYTQKVAKFGQKNRMTVYIAIQSGKPGNGCPPGGCH
jgi:hypothetical protein